MHTRIARVACALALGLLLGACGGGGGGGGGGLAGFPVGGSASGNGTTPNNPGSPLVDPNFTTVNLSVESVVDVLSDAGKPASISGTYFEGAKMADVGLLGTAVGDLSVLAGKTLYVIVEDPAGLFQASVQATPTTSPKPGLFVMLLGKTLQTPGTYTGNLRVYVCLDARCSVRLGNVPYNIPYNVVVKRGMKIEIGDAFKYKRGASYPGLDSSPDANIVAVASRFGQRPPVATMRVTLPEGHPFSALSVRPGDPLGFRPEVQITDNKDGTATVSMNVSDFLLRQGFHLSHMDVTSVAGDPPAQQLVRKSVEFLYLVDMDASASDPVVFVPQTLDLPASASAADIRTAFVRYTGARELSFSSNVEWLLTPQQQSAFPQENVLFIEPGGFINIGSDAQQLSFRGCVDVASIGGDIRRVCLQPDTYAFRIGYRYVRQDGVEFTGFYQGKLVVAP